MKEKLIDLHTHSTCSDGTFTPSEVVKEAKKCGLSAIALTDHDTIDGLCEAIAEGKKYGIEVVTGIEFSVSEKTEMHILGLDFCLPCPSITAVLDEMIENRKVRNIKTIELLNNMGIDINMDDILKQSTSDVIGRSQIAKAMLAKKYASSFKEAFDNYLSFGKPAYVVRKTLTSAEAIRVIHESKGKAILAHLNQIKLNDDELYETLVKFKKMGLDGIEGYYTEYTDEMNEKYRKMATQVGLKLSGGSDFHGKNKDNYNIGIGHGNLKIPYDLLINLRK